MQQIRSWLSALPFGDPLERRQALTLQLLILTLAGAIVLDLGAILITPVPFQSRLLLMVVVLVFLLCMLGALALLRRGHLALAATATIAALLLAISIAITLTGLRNQQIILLVFVLPLVLAGLLLGRRGLIVTLALCLAIPLTIALLEQQGMTWIGSVPLSETLVSIFALFTIVVGMCQVPVRQIHG
jgi:hypothetical protein